MPAIVKAARCQVLRFPLTGNLFLISSYEQAANQLTKKLWSLRKLVVVQDRKPTKEEIGRAHV